MSTTVVFVHGFQSGPECWEPFLACIKKDTDPLMQDFKFLCHSYPTSIAELNLKKRIPTIKECGNNLGEYLHLYVPDGQVMLVGHSMGGLVIQSFLAQMIVGNRAKELERIRSVIMFATPNRGATILGTLRELISKAIPNVQEEQLRPLNAEISDTIDIITHNLVDATSVKENSCPIPFRAFWGLIDNVVPEASARGPFVEASSLPGDHSGILIPEPKENLQDQRYLSLKDSILHPIGHPSIYELDLFDVTLTVKPNAADAPILLDDLKPPKQISTDNIATREIRLVFSKQNRCRLQWEQTYWSKDGFVKPMGETAPNEADAATYSEYLETGKKYSYRFTPEKGTTYFIKLKIWSGFGDKQRSWHDHLKPNARYKVYRITLNLQAYGDAGYLLAPPPSMYFYATDVEDHSMCDARENQDPLPPIASANPWVRTWEVANARGGVLDIVWDIKKPG